MSEKEKYPTRFHIGTQKAGSTYLYNLLSDHPDITTAKGKEVQFFSENAEKNSSWYESHFNGMRYRVDTSPDYFKHGKKVARRIHDFYGAPNDLCFVLILRNPIDYVASHFHMHRMHGHFADNSEEYPRVPESLKDMQEVRPSYFERGKYADLLDEWLEFFDKQQFKIIVFEEFIDNTDAVTTEICRFWSIPEPDTKLEVNEVSQNSAMRFSWLYTLRGKIAKHEWLKERLKENRLVNWVVDTLFNISPSNKLKKNERAMLTEVFAEDVKRLEDEWGIDTDRWEDF